MALGKQLPIRLEPDIDERLQAAAERIGTSKSALIRMLAKTFCDQVIRPDGSVLLPPNWRNLLPEADGRSVSVRYADTSLPHTALNEVSPKVSAVDKALMADDIARLRLPAGVASASSDKSQSTRRPRKAKA